MEVEQQFNYEGEVSDDDIKAWCELFGVDENELFDMSETEIHRRLDQCELRKKQAQILKEKTKHLNLKNFKIRSFTKESFRPGEKPLVKIPNDRKSISLKEVRKRGGQSCGCEEEEDSSAMFEILCNAAIELERTYGEDIFGTSDINPCISKNSLTELFISAQGCRGDYFDTSIAFDYDSNTVYFSSKKFTDDQEIITTKEIPLHKNIYECMFDNSLCDRGGDDDGVLQVMTFMANDKGDKKSTMVSYKGKTTEDTHVNINRMDPVCPNTCPMNDSMEDFGNPIYTCGTINHDILDQDYDDETLQYDLDESCENPVGVYRRGVFNNPDFESPGMYVDTHNTPGKGIPYHDPQQQALETAMHTCQTPVRACPRDTGAFDLSRVQPKRLQMTEQAPACATGFQRLKGLLGWGRS